MRHSHRMLILLFVAVVGPGIVPCGAQAPPQIRIPALPQNQNAQRLTLQDAESLAIQNHPQIKAATQYALAATAQVKEVQSAYYPQVTGSLSGADAQSDSRLAAGYLNSPTIYDKFAGGLTVTQLLTDFGHTHELSKSSHLHAQAQQENVVTTRADVLLRVNVTYFGVLRAQSILKVAEETVKARQLVVDQVSELAKSDLKSSLDVSFANVDLAKSQLLLVQAQNDVQASYAQFSDALGYSDQRTFQLVDEPMPGAPAPDLTPLVVEAFQNRPEIISQGLDVKSAQSYATAERDLWFPTISAAGVTGLIPYGQYPLPSRYAAAGFNVNVPIFNGRLFNALHAEATAQAGAQQQVLANIQNRIAQDVRTSWLNVISDYQRLALTEQLLYQTKQAFDLADARYRLGLSSIIELSQAQLNLTAAQIDQVSAQYDYESQTANLDYQLGRVK